MHNVINERHLPIYTTAEAPPIPLWGKTEEEEAEGRYGKLCKWLKLTWFVDKLHSAFFPLCFKNEVLDIGNLLG